MSAEVAAIPRPLVTIVLGIVGALVGGFIGRALGFYPPGHPTGFIMATIGAILVLFIYRKLVRVTP